MNPPPSQTATTTSTVVPDQPTSASDNRSSLQNNPQQQHSPTQPDLPLSTPLEMSTLSSNPPASDPNPASSPPLENTTSDASTMQSTGPVRTDTNTAMVQSMNPPPPPPAPSVPEMPNVSRKYSTAIGPSSDSPTVPAKDYEGGGPVLTVTLLLTSGARHPFKLDNKYFAKRNVEVPDNDPFNLSVYKLKELILREWREEWESKPTSPNYIRLISMGKLLDDKASLKDYKFGVESPNVLHMTIKPQDYVEEEDAKGGKSTYSANRETEGRSPGCRCVIM